uniref:Uncharacterized protein LOC111101264 n=1 Tax=Crassostrea virginica TaxID=6565 RepID=A0A8B8AD55_CRAVI|nr:uncharacterized protein LOC111101264 [Crassostrea virginica]
MDLDYSAQDVARCDLCKTAIVESYCDICHVNLCKPCIGGHISDDYDKHKIVPFQLRRSTPIYPKCEIHSRKTCKYQCKDCSIFLCTDCFASKQHSKEHKLLKLEDVFSKKKNKIQSDTEEIEKYVLPVYKDIASKIEKQIADIDGDYKKVAEEMSKQREKLHREIDNAMNQKEIEIGVNKRKHLAVLKKKLNEIKKAQSILQKTLYDLNEMMDSNEVCQTINYISKIQELSKLPPIIRVKIPIFIPKPINKEELGCLIGKLTPLSTTFDERVFTVKAAKELLDVPKVINTIQTRHGNLRSVTCLNEEEIWTSGAAADIISFNNQTLTKVLKTKSGNAPTGIAVDNGGALLYSDWRNQTVYKVENRHAKKIISLQGWTPTELCVTTSGDLLVTMFSDDKTQSKVVRYSGSTVKQTIQFDDDGDPLYSGNEYIKFITENRNLDICVADCGAGVVVVVNHAGKLQFIYNGHPSLNKDNPFNPLGITTNSQGHILTADGDNHCIHVLDSEGHTLLFIENCDLEYPLGLCVDNNDNLFVCENLKAIVKQIRYLK